MRNLGVQRRVLEALGKVNVGFASVIEKHEWITADGKLLMSVIGEVNEFYSDQLGVHVSKAARQKAEIGLPVGPVPLWLPSTDTRGRPTPPSCGSGSPTGSISASRRGSINGCLGSATE